MSVQIKGMEMPKNGCGDCPFLIRTFVDYCRLLKRDVADSVENGSRPSDCPLVEVPTPHGRLVDADDVNSHIVGFVDLSDCPTIIEAEGVE